MKLSINLNCLLLEISMTLNNLVGKTLEKITVEPNKIKRLIAAAKRNIADSKITNISLENRFDSAYRALRWFYALSHPCKQYSLLMTCPHNLFRSLLLSFA